MTLVMNSPNISIEYLPSDGEHIMCYGFISLTYQIPTANNLIL